MIPYSRTWYGRSAACASIPGIPTVPSTKLRKACSLTSLPSRKASRKGAQGVSLEKQLAAVRQRQETLEKAVHLSEHNAKGKPWRLEAEAV